MVTYRKGIELKANYHIVLHSVAGACVMLHIFKTSKKPPKSIKVTPFHGVPLNSLNFIDAMNTE